MSTDMDVVRGGPVMETSEHVDQLLPALMRARAAFKPIRKTKRVKVRTKAGAEYSFTFAPLDVIQDATEPALIAEQLMFISGMTPMPNGAGVMITRLYHIPSEQWLSSSVPTSAITGGLEDIKAVGGFETQSRRYNRVALLELCSEEDIDGTPATEDHIERRPKASPKGDTPASTRADAQAVTGAHPTIEQIEGLFSIALERCGETPEGLATRIRQMMGLPAQAATGKRLLARVMSSDHYGRLWAYYETLLGQLPHPTEASMPEEKALEVPTSSGNAEGPVGPVMPENGQPVESQATGQEEKHYATEEQIARLKALAAQVDEKATQDLAQVLEHYKQRLPANVAVTTEGYLRKQLAGTAVK